jgi:beta-N-acetylhexosaminidase
VNRHLTISCLVIFAFALVAMGCGSPRGRDATPSETSTVRTSLDVTTTTSIPTTTTSIATTTTRISLSEVLLQRMTLRQKAAQVLLLAFGGTTLSADTQALLTEAPPGGVLLLGRNVTGAAQLRSLTAALQDAAEAGGSSPGLFVAVDQEGGSVQRLQEGVPRVPAARTLGDDSSPAEAGRLAEETAAGLLALGVNMNLAPVADVVADRRSFLYERTYGDDPARVAAFVGAVTEAFSRSGLITVVKHFPGHGSALGNTHGGTVISDATRADFATVHLPPFQAAFEAGAEGVMMAHIIARAYDAAHPASQSGAIVGGLLRGELDFAGLVVTDDLEMAAAAAEKSGEGRASEDSTALGEATVSALEAGCDLLISTGTLVRQRAMVDAIVEAVQTGRLTQGRLDQAVLHVLELKLRHGIVAPQP